MSLLKETIKMLQELKQSKPQSPPRICVEHACFGTAGKDKENNSSSQVPSESTSHSFCHLRDVHPISHRVYLHQYALDADFGNIPILMHLESVTQVTDISFHPNHPNAHF